jgi:hypothetical protein
MVTPFNSLFVNSSPHSAGTPQFPLVDSCDRCFEAVARDRNVCKFPFPELTRNWTRQVSAKNVSYLSAPRACNNRKVKLAEIIEP